MLIFEPYYIANLLHRALHRIHIIIIQQWRKMGNGKALKHLSTLSFPPAASFHTVFSSILQQHPFSEREVNKIIEIENVRHDLQHNYDVIKMVDYGAGSPNLSLIRLPQPHQRILQLPVAHIYRNASSHRKWGKLLFRLIREFKPTYCLEFGTSLGISALYQLAALSLNKKGRLTTMEGSEEVARIARHYFTTLGYSNMDSRIGVFDELLPNVVRELPKIDFAFIDGHHEEKATINYFDTLLPHLSENAILVFDDINWSDGMRKAWEHIIQNDAVHLSFDVYKLGICVINTSSDAHSHYVISL